MDSMRSLNTSLPRTSRPRQPPAELLQAFKSAALSVTQLYKSATADYDSTRAAGYQDALDDLLEFLDQENMGLGDGEGWRVRQWATQRLSSNGCGSDGVDMDQDDIDHPPRTRSSAPPADTTPQQPPQPSQEASTQTDAQRVSPPDNQHPRNHNQEVFHFRASPPPARTDSPTVIPISPSEDPPIFSNNPAIHLQVMPRGNSRLSRHNSSGPSRDRIPSISLGNLGHGAGSKRKHNISEFFDLSGLGNGPKDGSPGGGPGGKRGRFA